MGSRRLLAVLVSAVVLLAGFVPAYLRWGCQWLGRTERQLGLYPTEFDAADTGINQRTSAAMSEVASGETVAVLWSEFGKDYWACYVRTPDGARGWILCTALVRL